MAIQDINLGTEPLGTGGDTARAALTKINENFDELDARATDAQSGADASLKKAQNLADVADAAAARTNIGLGSVNNTSDANKPVSVAVQAALDGKENQGVAELVASLAMSEHEAAADPHPQYATPAEAAAAAPVQSVAGKSGAVSLVSGDVGGLGELATMNTGVLGAYRNKLINGGFEINQRGTAQTVGGIGSTDRWNVAFGGTSVSASVNNFALGQTDVPGNPLSYFRMVVSSVPGAASYAVLQQSIENVRTLSGGPATLSFWAKADVAGPAAVEFAQNFGTGGSPSAVTTGIGSQQIALTTAWKKYEITVDVPSIAGKALGTDGNNRLVLVLWLDAGSDYNTRSAGLGQRSGAYEFTKLQLEEGDTATAFEVRHPAQELELCHRYCRAFGGDSANPVLGWGQCTSSTGAAVQVQIGNMRGIPSLGYIGNFILLNAAGTALAVTSMAIGPGGTNRKIARIGVGTAGGLVAGDATVLCGGNIDARIILDAEL